MCKREVWIAYIKLNEAMQLHEPRNGVKSNTPLDGFLYNAKHTNIMVNVYRLNKW